MKHNLWSINNSTLYRHKLGLHTTILLCLSYRPTNTLWNDSAQIVYCFTHLKYWGCSNCLNQWFASLLLKILMHFYDHLLRHSGIASLPSTASYRMSDHRITDQRSWNRLHSIQHLSYDDCRLLLGISPTGVFPDKWPLNGCVWRFTWNISCESLGCCTIPIVFVKFGLRIPLQNIMLLGWVRCSERITDSLLSSQNWN